MKKELEKRYVENMANKSSLLFCYGWQAMCSKFNFLTDVNDNYITPATILLFGTDNMIASACARHKTDCLYRVYNLVLYDERDVIDTNLLDSYDRLFDFGQKIELPVYHGWDSEHKRKGCDSTGDYFKQSGASGLQ